jgi:signal transduction histidine kinase
MEWFLLDHNSVGRLATIILCLMVACFLVLKKDRTSSLRFFACFFVFSLFYHVGVFIACTVLIPEGAVGWFFTAFAPLGMVCLVQFAYRFPHRISRKESAVVAVLTFLLISAGIVDYVYEYSIGYIGWHIFAYGPAYTTRILPVSTAVLYLWAIIVFLRQSVHVSREEGDARPFLSVVFKPRAKDARTAQHLALVVCAELLLCVLLAIEATFHVITPVMMNNLQNSGYMLIYLSYIVIYINNSSRPTSLLVKMLAISLVMVFIVLTAAGQFGLSKIENAVESLYQTRSAYVVENYRGGGSVADDVSFIVSRPLSDGRFGSHFTLNYSYDEKFDLLRLQEREFLDRDSSRGLEIRRSSIVPARSEDVFSGMRLVSGKDTVYFFFTRVDRDMVYYVGYDYLLFRGKLHDVALSVAILYVLATVFILVFLPMLFRSSILAPVRRIMYGAKLVKDGNLDIELPVQFDDEIGFLTRVFNQMVQSLKTSKKYQDHYYSQLEDAFVKIEASRKEVEDNFSELRRIHTALAESEMRYKVLNAQLELRVDDRTSRLEYANSELVTTLSRLKDAQNELIRTEKMAALGDMVAGMAHEINTPLGVAITASSLIDRSMAEVRAAFENGTMTRGDLERYINSCTESSQIIQANLGRAGELVQSFKLVAADQSSEERRSFDLCDYARDVLVSLQPSFKKTGHRIVVSCGESVPVYSYPGSFSQIITNFAMNSLLHAYPGRNDGIMTITITVENEVLLLNYRDDGCGIEPENLDKIFNPFFTTKRQKGGTGLGLHVVYNIVTQKLAGMIDVESRPGEGVHFIVRIPMSQMRISGPA